MAEFVGLGYFAEVPAVIWDVQRAGPSTGLPTRTSQGDILSAYFLSHGDTKHIVLIPASVGECFDFGAEAFNLAERFQTPVFVLSDLDLGMNIWMSDPFSYPQRPLDRGKVLSAADLDRLGKFSRYRDVDGDGIPYRTLPGTDHPLAAYFTRGSGHNEHAEYSERGKDYRSVVDRLAKKLETAKEHVPVPEVLGDKPSDVGIIAFGTSHWAVLEARDQLAAEGGIKSRYLRLRALPFTEHLARFVRSCQRVYVVEQNRDAQMAQLIRIELSEQPDELAKLRSVLYYDGNPIDARTVTNAILAAEKD
jgi:2-oxoglutarate ferredoxin oxidoreductase subunit alpha